MILTIFVGIPLIWIGLFLFNFFVLIRNKDVLEFYEDDKIGIFEFIISPIMTGVSLLVIFICLIGRFFKFINHYKVELEKKKL
jgi:hypothetical protein